MFLRLLLCVSLATLGLAGCSMFDNKKDKPATEKKKKDEKPKPATIKDQSNDPAFQSFLGRLRIAVAQKDKRQISEMMAPSFGYRWDDVPPGETPFDYWDKNNYWPELETLLSQRFVPHESYMVAPAQFASDPNYRNFRVGIRQFSGSWRLAYFVTGEDILQ
jgi:hypothetical protein